MSEYSERIFLKNVEKYDILDYVKDRYNEVMILQYIGKLDKEKLKNYKEKIITEEVVLTDEILYEHIMKKHLEEYKQLKKYLKDIIEVPNIILEDNKNENTLILLKKIPEIKKNGRVVVKIAVAGDEKHPKNSIITLMKLNDRTWKQTIKNRGNIIYQEI